MPSITTNPHLLDKEMLRAKVARALADRLQQLASTRQQRAAEADMDFVISPEDVAFIVDKSNRDCQRFDAMQQRVTEALMPASSLPFEIYEGLVTALSRGPEIMNRIRLTDTKTSIVDNHHLVGTVHDRATPHQIADAVVRQWYYPEAKSGVVLPIGRHFEVRWSRRLDGTNIWATTRTGWDDSDKRIDAYFRPSVKASDALEVHTGAVIHSEAALDRMHEGWRDR